MRVEIHLFSDKYGYVVHIDNRNTKGSQFQSDTQLSPKPLYLFSGLAVKKEYLKELYSIVAQLVFTLLYVMAIIADYRESSG